MHLADTLLACSGGLRSLSIAGSSSLVPSHIHESGTVTDLLALDAEGKVWKGRVGYTAGTIEWTLFTSDC
jgi:hypothetical protein